MRATESEAAVILAEDYPLKGPLTLEFDVTNRTRPILGGSVVDVALGRFGYARLEEGRTRVVINGVLSFLWLACGIVALVQVRRPLKQSVPSMKSEPTREVTKT